MTIYYGARIGVPQWVTGTHCDKLCHDHCPDFTIKRQDTKPPFKVAIEDCAGTASHVLQERNLIAEVSMWAKARLKHTLAVTDTYFSLADNIGFDHMLEGDIVIMDRVRNPEKMLITGFDEDKKIVYVERGYQGTTISHWHRGASMKIFRIKDAPAIIERRYDDVLRTDGTTGEDELTATYLVYEWQPRDTCVPGCFMLEFKLLQMLHIPSDISIISSAHHHDHHYHDHDHYDHHEHHEHEHDEHHHGPEVIIPWTYDMSDISTISAITVTDCSMGEGVDWIRKYPQTSEGFVIQVLDSPAIE
jgi:hypothetical protein